MITIQSSSSKPMVLNWKWFCALPPCQPAQDVWQHLEKLLVVTTQGRGCSWHRVSTGSAKHPTRLEAARDSEAPSPVRTVPRLGKPLHSALRTRAQETCPNEEAGDHVSQDNLDFLKVNVFFSPYL